MVGEVLERIGPHPDLVAVFVTGGHGGALEDIGAAIRAILSPSVLLGVVAPAVVGPGDDVDPGPGVSLWAGLVGPVAPLVLMATGRVPPPPPFVPSGAVLLGDATSPPFVASVAGLPGPPGLLVAGGRTTRAGLLIQDRLVSATIVGALVGPAVRLRTVVSRGARPIGELLVVTRAERDIVYELDGQAAFDRLMGIVADGMPAQDVRLVNDGLRVAVAGPLRPGAARPDTPRPGTPPPTLTVRGVDRANGALALDGAVGVGSTIRFEVRDPCAASAALENSLDGFGADGPPQAALLFRSEQRNVTWFGGAASDALVVCSAIGDVPLAGCATGSEIGPDIEAPGPWTQTASVALFDEVGTHDDGLDDRRQWVG